MNAQINFIEKHKQENYIKAFKWVNIKKPELIKLFIDSVDFVDKAEHQDNVILHGIAQQPIDKAKQKELAQYFTPPDVALYTSIQLLNNYENGDNIYDPSIGKGGLLIASASVLAIEHNLRDEKLISTLRGSEICSDTYIQAIENIYNAIKQWTKNITKKDALIMLKKNIVNKDFFCCQIPKNSLIIANPPYKEIYGTGNVWLKFAEKIINHNNTKAFGIIVPVSITCAARTKNLRDEIIKKFGEITAFHHETRPRPLFKNVEQRISILHATKTKNTNKYRTTDFLTHRAKDRLSIWESKYVELDYIECNEVFPKLSTKSVLFFRNNLKACNRLCDYLDPLKENYLWVRTTGRYKLQAQLNEPDEITTKWKKVFLNKIGARILIEIFKNGKALEWWKIYGDGRDMSLNRFLHGFGVDEWMKSNNCIEMHMKQSEIQDGEWQKKVSFQQQPIY